MRRGRSARVRPRLAWSTGLLAIAAVWLVACAPASVEREGEITSATPIGDVFAPRFEIDAGATHIERFDPPGAGAGFALAVGSTVRNPNAFPVVLQRVEYTLSIAGEAVATGRLEPSLELNAGESGALDWTIAADLTERRGLWSAVVGAYAGTPLPFEIEGRLVFASQSYVFTTGTRALMGGTALAREAVRSPRLRLDGVTSRIALVRSDAPVAVITLVAVNPGEVGYFLSARDVVLELGGFVLATLDLGPVPMPAGETIRTEITFLIDRARLTADAEAALSSVLAGHRGAVRVKGNFVYDVLGVDSFPVDLQGDLEVTLPGRVAATDDVDPDDDAP
jgi:hypothetical protein